MNGGGFLLACVIGIAATTVYLFRSSPEADLSPGRRLLVFVVCMLVGAFFLHIGYDALELDIIRCGRGRRPMCHKESDPVFFWLNVLIFYTSGVAAIAAGILALFRPNAAANLRG